MKIQAKGLKKYSCNMCIWQQMDIWILKNLTVKPRIST